MEPFSNENLHKDSTMFHGKLVEHLTSWLTINPIKGCSLQCAYCFRVNWHESEKPTQVSAIEDSLAALFGHPLFLPDLTPISVNNSSTDPLLPGAKKATFFVLESLEKCRYKNPFIIISKLQLSDDEISFLQSLKFARPIFFSSLSFVPKYIEPTPLAPRLRNLKKLKAANIPRVLYYRPIVKGWNDAPETIEMALKTGQEYCNAICIGGLRMSPEIRSRLKRVGEDFKHFPDDFHRKTFEVGIEAKVLSLYEKLNLSVPLFKHSSCAVSNILGERNYNHLYKNPSKNCLTTCPSLQQKLCNQ